MQIFIIGSVLETSKKLDKRRFHRQISEARLILQSIQGEKHWKGPLVEMYRGHIYWLNCYIKCFEYYRDGNYDMALNMNTACKVLTPSFFTEEYYTNMKRRLYTKDHNFYGDWAILGESYVNMYWKNDSWVYMKQ